MGSSENLAGKYNTIEELLYAITVHYDILYIDYQNEFSSGNKYYE